MKKTALLIALAFGISSAFAQDLTSKKGEPILPEAGDWAIGFDASPLIHTGANLFNASTDNKVPQMNFVGKGMEITGKMFKTEKVAYRAKVRLGLNSNTTASKEVAMPITSPVSYVDNETKMSSHNISLGGGIEMRKGKTRLQGFYGAEGLINLAGSKTTYTYGNALSATNPGARVTETKAGSTFGFTVRGFIGVEYFVLPKISLAAEYGFAVAFKSTGEGSQAVDSWNGTTTESTTTPTGKSSSFGMDNDNSGAGVTIMFHF